MWSGKGGQVLRLSIIGGLQYVCIDKQFVNNVIAYNYYSPVCSSHYDAAAADNLDYQA